jgi:lipid-binding SYLF domain-containing protein
MKPLALLALAGLCAACASLSPEELAEKRAALDAMGAESVARLIEEQPEAEAVFDEAVGYAVFDVKLTKVPVFGAGGGTGVVVDHRDGSHSYVRVSRLDIGGGWGVRAFKMLIAISDEKVLDRAESGRWKFEAGAEAAVGGASAEGGTGDVGDRSFSSYVLAEGGASATVTLRVIRIKPYLQ